MRKCAILVAPDAKTLLDESFDFERHAFSFRPPNKCAVDLEDAQFYSVFNRKVRQPFVASFSDKLRRNFENPHFDEALKGFFIKTH